MGENIVFSICYFLEASSGVLFCGLTIGIITNFLGSQKITNLEITVAVLAIIIACICLILDQWLKQIYYKSKLKETEQNKAGLKEDRQRLIRDKEQLQNEIQNYQTMINSYKLNQNYKQIGGNEDGKNRKDN